MKRRSFGAVRRPESACVRIQERETRLLVGQALNHFTEGLKSTAAGHGRERQRGKRKRKIGNKGGGEPGDHGAGWSPPRL